MFNIIDGAMQDMNDLQTNQSPHICIIRGKQESQGSSNCGQHEQRTDKRTAVIWHKPVRQSTQPNPYHHQHTLRNTQQSCMQRIKMQALDDKSRKVGNAAIRDIGRKAKQREEPGLVVQIGLLDLFPVDSILLYAGLVASHPRNHDELLVMRKAPDGSRRVGQADEEAYSPNGAKGTNDDELIAPWRQHSLDLADAVSWNSKVQTLTNFIPQIHSSQSPQGHFPILVKVSCESSLTNKTTPSNTDSIKRIPRRYPRRLLRPRVVHGRDEHKGRVGNCLECPRQNPKSQQGLQILHRGLAHEQRAPHEDVEGEVIGGRAALHEEVGRDGPDQPAKVKAARQP